MDLFQKWGKKRPIRGGNPPRILNEGGCLKKKGRKEEKLGPAAQEFMLAEGRGSWEVRRGLRDSGETRGNDTPAPDRSSGRERKKRGPTK